MPSVERGARTLTRLRAFRADSTSPRGGEEGSASLRTRSPSLQVEFTPVRRAEALGCRRSSHDCHPALPIRAAFSGSNHQVSTMPMS